MADRIIASGLSSTIPPLGGTSFAPDHAPRVRGVQGALLDLDDREPPPVIVNPKASVSGLLEWANGQLKNLDGLLLPISCGQGEIDLQAYELATTVREFMLQSIAALNAAQSALAAASVAPQSSARAYEGMLEALNDGADAHHALQATLKAMAGEISDRCSGDVCGLLDAALASVEKLDGAMSRGLQAGGVQ